MSCELSCDSVREVMLYHVTYHVTHPDIQVSYSDLVQGVHSREELGYITHGNGLSQVILCHHSLQQLVARNTKRGGAIKR